MNKSMIESLENSENADLSPEQLNALFDSRNLIEFYRKNAGFLAARVVEKMDRLEDWTLDHMESVKSGLRLLARKSDERMTEDQLDDLIFLSSFLHSSKAIALFDFYSDSIPVGCESIYHYLRGCRELPESINIERLETLEKLGVLIRVFGTFNLASTIRALVASDDN